MVRLAWSPAISRIYSLGPYDLLDLTPLQLKAFEQDEPSPLL